MAWLGFPIFNRSLEVKEIIIMKQKQIVLLFVGVLLAGAMTACGGFGEDPTPEPVPVAVSQPNVVSAEAFVVPLQEANLAFEVGGKVVSVEVEEGETVAEGQLLARLNDSTQQAQMAESEAAVARAEAGLAQAQAALARAEAQLAQVEAGPTQAEIDQAEADVARAEAFLADRVAGATPEEIGEAEARVATAQAQLAQVLAGSRDEDVKAAASQLLQTEADVRLAQADYDENVFGEPDQAEPFGIALQQSTLEFERAQAEYEKVLNGATDEEAAVSRAQANEAQATMARVLAGASPEEIAQAQAEVQRAAAVLANVIDGSTPAEIAISEAQVAEAEAGVQTAESDIKTAEAGMASAQAVVAQTQLTAPFNGIVGIIPINPGEIVQPGALAMAVGNTSRWQIETDDLTEIDVVQVQPGASVQISVDALPDREFEGEVVRVTPKSETKAGDVTYTVVIDITQGDTSLLHWGMTTFVDIEISPEL
jgi:HlyD family secretion protein